MDRWKRQPLKKWDAEGGQGRGPQPTLTLFGLALESVQLGLWLRSDWGPALGACHCQTRGFPGDLPMADEEVTLNPGQG